MAIRDERGSASAPTRSNPGRKLAFARAVLDAPAVAAANAPELTPLIDPPTGAPS